MRKFARTVWLLATAAAFASAPAWAGDEAAEVTNAAMHANLAAQASDVATVHTHLHHAVNCLVGPGGTGFDAKALNPCANTGGSAIPDATGAAAKAKLQQALATAQAGLSATGLATAKKDAAQTAAALKAIK